MIKGHRCRAEREGLHKTLLANRFINSLVSLNSYPLSPMLVERGETFLLESRTGSHTMRRAAFALTHWSGSQDPMVSVLALPSSRMTSVKDLMVLSLSFLICATEIINKSTHFLRLLSKGGYKYFVTKSDTKKNSVLALANLRPGPWR